MRGRIYTRIIIGLVMLLLFAALVVGILLLGNRPVKDPYQGASPQGAQTSDADAGMENSPFVLSVNESRIGSDRYLSFSVFFKNDRTEELLYTCGHSFLASKVQRIVWAGQGYDILVEMKEGEAVRFAFDGSERWDLLR